MSEKNTNNHNEINSAADWYPEGASFIEQNGLQGAFSLSHFQSYEGFGSAGATEAIRLRDGNSVVFIESNTPMTERKPFQAPEGIQIKGDPEYTSSTATALLSTETGYLIGYASIKSKQDQTQYYMDNFAFNMQMIEMLPEGVAKALKRIDREHMVFGLKVDELYRGQGKAQELIMLLLAYAQNKGVEKVIVGTDSTMQTDRNTGEVSSFYKRTGADGPMKDNGGWVYDVDKVVEDSNDMLADLLCATAR